MDGRTKRKKNIPLRYCETCGVAIHRGTKSTEKRINIKQYIKARFCSEKCKGIWQSEVIVGERNPNYRGGKSKCIDCDKDLADRYSYRKTLRCRDCWCKHSFGENSSNWKGGKTGINELLRKRKETKQWRLDVFQRDDFTCQICGDDKGGNLNTHHIKRWIDYPELRHDIDNGITLCKECHILIHKKQ